MDNTPLPLPLHVVARNGAADPAGRVAVVARLDCWADMLEDAADQFVALARQVESGEVTTVYAKERVRFHLSRMMTAEGL